MHQPTIALDGDMILECNLDLVDDVGQKYAEAASKLGTNCCDVERVIEYVRSYGAPGVQQLAQMLEIKHLYCIANIRTISVASWKDT